MEGKILPLVTEPDPRLHIISKPVERITDDIKQLLQDMLTTMYSSEGIGLAAVQVGVHLKVVVIDIDQNAREEGVPLVHEGKPIFMINPEIVEKSSEMVTFCEGCLSLPTVRADVVRRESVTVEYLDHDGTKHRKKLDGLLAICAQHEIDHTHGIIFIDHLSRLKRDFFMKKLMKLKKEQK